MYLFALIAYIWLLLSNCYGSGTYMYALRTSGSYSAGLTLWQKRHMPQVPRFLGGPREALNERGIQNARGPGKHQTAECVCRFRAFWGPPRA